MIMNQLVPNVYFVAIIFQTIKFRWLVIYVLEITLNIKILI